MMTNILDAETFQSRLQRLQEADAAMMPFGNTLGFEVERVVSGEAVVVMPCRQKLHNIFGYTHGGAIFSLADTAMGLAHIASLQPHQTATTVGSTINFLRPALSGQLRAHARCVKHGRTLSFFECNVEDGEGRLIARSSATMMTLSDDRSEGRDRLHSAEPELYLHADSEDEGSN
jgi:acyl-CoA thioesterase